MKCKEPVWFDAQKTTQLYVIAQGERGTVRCDGKTYNTEESRLRLELDPLRINNAGRKWSGLTLHFNQPYNSGSGFQCSRIGLQPRMHIFNRKTSDHRSDYEIHLLVDLAMQDPWGSSFGFVVAERFTVPVHLLVDPHVVMGLQALLLQAEGILLCGEDAAGKDAVDAAVLHIQWLITFVLPNRAQVRFEMIALHAFNLFLKSSATLHSI